jgi:hypothetical protein
LIDKTVLGSLPNVLSFLRGKYIICFQKQLIQLHLLRFRFSNVAVRRVERQNMEFVWIWQFLAGFLVVVWAQVKGPNEKKEKR